ncbi:MAG: cupin domain-containing protein [Flavobacteriaceae bacterium]|nr:cupin domain-containing protein [Flavobacteriaceae bacterium]
MFYKISEIDSKEIIPGFRGRFVHAKNFTIAFWEIEAGAVLPEHAHIHEQTTQVLEGQLELTINGKTTMCTAGSIVVIPPNAVHKGKALSHCKLTDTFCPVREDYKF